MYTILIRINAAKEQYELIKTNNPSEIFKEGKMTRQGLAKFLDNPNFDKYSLDQLMDCECVKVFAVDRIQNIEVGNSNK